MAPLIPSDLFRQFRQLKPFLIAERMTQTKRNATTSGRRNPSATISPMQRTSARLRGTSPPTEEDGPTTKHFLTRKPAPFFLSALSHQSPTPPSPSAAHAQLPNSPLITATDTEPSGKSILPSWPEPSLRLPDIMTPQPPSETPDDADAQYQQTPL